MKERLVIIHLSDLHITKYNNLLELLINNINNDFANLVIITGDLVHFNNDEELYKIASNTVKKIKHKTVLVPGDYDCGELWNKYFGASYQNIFLNGYNIDLLDTSFMGHKYGKGWSEVLKDTEQHNWLKKSLEEKPNYHLIFSHHPFWVVPNKQGDEYLKDNVRAVYSGHLHDPTVFYFKYQIPKVEIPNGFVTVPLKFHGNACYHIIIVNDKDEISHVPRLIKMKRTAW